MLMMNLDIRLEGVLFYKASPMTFTALAKLFSVSEDGIRTSAEALEKRLCDGATRLIITDKEVELVTAPELDPIIEAIRRDEMRRDIGKAGAETLAIILYRGPISRADIDRIRGVNSSFIVRNLMMRGLVAREQSGRNNSFTVTPQLLAHLGVTRASELPDYATTLDQLEVFEAAQAAEVA